MGLGLYTQIPFSYVCMLAFRKLLQCENKHDISKDILLEFYKEFIELVLNDEDIQEDLKKQRLHIEFQEEDLTSFLEQYSDLFSYDSKKNIIYLKESCGIEQLETYLSAIEKQIRLDVSFRAISNNDYLKEVLNITSILEECSSQLGYEDMLFQCYEKYLEYPSSEMLEEIKKRLYFRNEWYGTVLSQNNDKVYVYEEECEMLLDEELENMDITLPVDFEIWENSKFCKIDQEESLDPYYVSMEQAVSTIYQYALFSKNNLSALKLCYDMVCIVEDLEDLDLTIPELTKFYSKNASNPKMISRIYTLEEDSNLLFYLLLINKIDEYQLSHGKNNDLQQTKIRLIYSLDNFGLFLLNPDNLKYHLQKRWQLLEEEEYDIDDFRHLKTEAYYFIQDIFESNKNDKNSILKKLFFISSYYEITRDEEIIRILEEYQDYPKYVQYCNLIFGKSKVKSKYKIKLN